MIPVSVQRLLFLPQLPFLLLLQVQTWRIVLFVESNLLSRGRVAVELLSASPVLDGAATPSPNSATTTRTRVAPIAELIILEALTLF